MATETIERPTKRFISDREWRASDTTTTPPGDAMLSTMPEMRVFGRPSVGFVVVVSDAPPAWVTPTVQAINRVLNLPSNWDSYGSGRVSPEIAGAALKLLLETMGSDSPVPSVVPTSHGGIQLEWHTNGVDLEVELTSTIRLSGSFEDARTGDAWEKDLTYDIRPLTDAIARLSSNQ